MDWSVVVMGCALVLGSLGVRWWERARAPEGGTPEPEPRFFWGWVPLLMGVGMIGGRVPGLVHASYRVVEFVDAFDFVLAVTVLFLAVRSVRRFFRTRDTV